MYFFSKFNCIRVKSFNIFYIITSFFSQRTSESWVSIYRGGTSHKEHKNEVNYITIGSRYNLKHKSKSEL